MTEPTFLQKDTFTDKSTWPEGPWKQEPDKAYWIDPATNLDCLIVRGPVGALCGYVGVPEGHPFFEKDYNDCGAEVSAHGGLTFASFCAEDEKQEGICHAPPPGRPDKVWWLGFDASHYNDVSPMMNWSFGQDKGDFRHYRTFDYMIGQCQELAAQLKAVELQPA